METVALERFGRPSVTKRTGETLYKWGNLLAVIVFDSGEVGQFSTSLAISRSEIEGLVEEYSPSKS